jgi:hypothetical protein
VISHDHWSFCQSCKRPKLTGPVITITGVVATRTTTGKEGYAWSWSELWGEALC